MNISPWTIGMTRADNSNYDYSWTKEITKHKKQNWKTYSKPEYFFRKGENATMLVFRNEGIIFKRVTNL